jgi:hypothetical protein
MPNREQPLQDGSRRVMRGGLVIYVPRVVSSR